MSDVLDEPDNDPTVIEPEQQEVAEVEQEAPPEVEAEAPEEAAVPQVPIHTLHEARQQNRELRNQMQGMTQQLESLQKLKDELNEQRQQAQAQQNAEQFNTDPLGAIQQDLQALKAQQEQATQQTQTDKEAAAQQQALEAAVSTSVAEFSKSTPDYPEALNYMLESRAKEMEFMGATQEQIQAALQQESFQLAQSAFQNGENAAELVYNLAKLRGYNATPTKAAPSVESLEKGQAAAQTISNTQGDADEVSLVDIEKMSDAEFDAYWDKEMNPGVH